jgi:hypothetical protein
VYESITADEVKQAAIVVLRAENCTVGILEPKPEPATDAKAEGAR